MAADKISVLCCVAGGGPAGIMLGLLLARAGVEVLVLEKHADFFRDFRGDTIHPSTLEVMHELGFLEDLLRLPHQKVPRLIAQFGGLALTFADFTHLPTHCGFIAFMPQWDFLNFLAARGARYPTFKLRMRAEVTGLIEEAGRIVGLHATTPGGPLEVRAGLVVAADGRHSVLRDKAGLRIDELGAPMDVLWFRLSRRPGDPGCDRRRKPAGSTAARGAADHRGPRTGATAARMADPHHPEHADLHAESDHQARPGKRGADCAAVRHPARRAVPAPEPDPRQADRDRGPTRACANARRVKEKEWLMVLLSR